METTDQPDQENSEQVNPDDQQGGAISKLIRSYECTFCKRGFSNAQALGGHMNIHRKDKAKLKHSSNEAKQSLNMPKVVSSSSPIVANITQSFMESKYNEDRSSSIKWAWILDKESDIDQASTEDKTHAGEIKQLSLFDDKSSSKDEQKPSSQVHESTEESLSSSASHGLSSLELDLELRLGPDPQDSSPATGTKNFF